MKKCRECKYNKMIRDITNIDYKGRIVKQLTPGGTPIVTVDCKHPDAFGLIQSDYDNYYPNHCPVAEENYKNFFKSK